MQEFKFAHHCMQECRAMHHCMQQECRSAHHAHCVHAGVWNSSRAVHPSHHIFFSPFSGIWSASRATHHAHPIRAEAPLPGEVLEVKNTLLCIHHVLYMPLEGICVETYKKPLTITSNIENASGANVNVNKHVSSFLSHGVLHLSLQASLSITPMAQCSIMRVHLTHWIRLIRKLSIRLIRKLSD